MITTIKENKLQNCRWKNGWIWIQGEPEDEQSVAEAIRIFDENAHKEGLTERIESFVIARSRAVKNKAMMEESLMNSVRWRQKLRFKTGEWKRMFKIEHNRIRCVWSKRAASKISSKSQRITAMQLWDGIFRIRDRPSGPSRRREISLVTERASAGAEFRSIPNSVIDAFIELLQIDAGTRCAVFAQRQWHWQTQAFR